MDDALANKADKKEAVEKQVSLTVIPPGDESQDIHVEVKRRLSIQKRRTQRRFAALFLLILALMVLPMARDGYA